MKYSSHFRDKVVVITGGATGIGLALAKRLAACGAHVIIASRSEEKLACAAASLRGSGLSVETAQLDVRERDAFRRIAADVVARHGRIDFLFNNAGISLLGEARDYTDDDWDDLIDVDLRGVVNGVCAAYPHMLERRSGHIVNVSSLSGIVPTPFGVGYTAAKFGVVGLSQALRLEAERYGIRVSVVCPAAVQTPLTETIACRHVDREEFIRAVPSKFTDADDCADAVLAAVRKNRAVITPGAAASLFALLERFAPWATRMIMRRVTRVAAKIRDRHSMSVSSTLSLPST